MRWSEVFPDMVEQGGGGAFSGSADDILARYEQYADTNANQIYTPENFMDYLMLNPEEDAKYSNSIVNLLGNEGKVDIPVSSSRPVKEVVSVSGVLLVYFSVYGHLSCFHLFSY